MRNILLISFIFIFIGFSNSQKFEWVKNFGLNYNPGSNDQSIGQSIAKDSDGYIYVAGFHDITSNNSNTFYLIKLDQNGTNIIWQNNYILINPLYKKINLEVDNSNNIIIQIDNKIRKVNQNGLLVWEKNSSSGTGLNRTVNFTLDNNGNIYIIGAFNGTLDFNPGSGINEMTNNSPNYKIFIQKLDSDGNYISSWNDPGQQGPSTSVYLTSSQFSSNDLNYDMKIINEFGNEYLYVLGKGIVQNTNQTFNGAYLLKFNINSVWISDFYISNFIRVTDCSLSNFREAKLTVSSNGNISVIANFTGNYSLIPMIDFDHGSNIVNLNDVGNNGFIAKINYDNSLNFLSVKRVIQDWANRIDNFNVCEDLNDNLFFIGTFFNTIDFNPDINISNNLISIDASPSGIPNGARDLFIIKYNNSCVFQNSFQIGNFSNESAQDILISGNELFITGQFDKKIQNQTIFYPVDFNFDQINDSILGGPPTSFALKLNICPSYDFVNAGNDVVSCGQPITLNASGGNSFSWNNNVENGIAFIPNIDGDYIVTGYDSQGCEDKDTLIVTIGQNSSSNINVNSIDIYTLNGQSYNQSGTYIQNIINSTGCDSIITLYLTLSYSNILEINENYINIFPNPIVDFVNIEFKGVINKFEIFDTKGIKVFHSIENNKFYTIPSNIQKGYYFLNIETDNGIYTKQLLIE